VSAAPVQLLIDAGNSRLKWRLLRGTRPGRVQAVAWGQGPRAGTDARVAAALLRAAGRAAGRAQIARLLVCSVAGSAREQALAKAARAAGLPAPQFIRSRRRAAGVRNGYLESWRLGADRWVALIGARLQHPGRALCIVDVGTALTIDLLDAGGAHRGGLLVPGPELMVRTLLTATSGIRRRAGARFALLSGARATPAFGRSTRSGLASGALLACAALIDRACREARSTLGKAPLLLLSGGAARSIAPRLRTRARLSEELVLAGLAALAGSLPAARQSR
jgi:type III pantothenate kinase